MAFFDKAVLPGGEGKVTLKINTAHYSGTRRWTARIYTNDPLKPETALKIQAHIKVPVSVSPWRIDLHAMEGESMTREVEIRALLGKPLTLEPLEFKLQKKVTYEIEEVEKNRRFKIRFTNLPGPPGTFKGSLTLKTNYNERPSVTIKINGRIGKKG